MNSVPRGEHGGPLRDGVEDDGQPHVDAPRPLGPLQPLPVHPVRGGPRRRRPHPRRRLLHRDEPLGIKVSERRT